MKKLRMLLTATVILLTMAVFALPVSAGYNFAYGGDDWSGTGYVGDDFVRIDKIFVDETHFVFPSEYDGIPVTSIGDGAFQDSDAMESIVIPKTIRSIGEGVFAECPYLQKITVEAGNPVYRSEGNCIIEIETNRVIAGCAESVIPDSATSIGTGAFQNCDKLVSIEIPDTVRQIGNNAFANCDLLRSFTVPANVRSIGEGVFVNCPNLKTLNVDAGNSAYFSRDNCVIEKDSKTLIAVCNGFQIPTDGSVEVIGASVFRNDGSLTQITIPDSVTTIGTSAFAGCTALKKIVIGSGVTYLEPGVFYGCSGLAEISVSANNSAYYSQGNCVIRKADGKVVLGCKNSVIPDSQYVTVIGAQAFWGCTGLTSITIPDAVTTIESGAFEGCEGLAGVHLGKGVSEVAASAFYGCEKLTSLTVDGANKTYLCKGNCLILKSEKKLVIGFSSSAIPSDGSVEIIGGGAFYGCSGMTEITIPASVLTIEADAFDGCQKLDRVIIDSKAVAAALTDSTSCGRLTMYAEEVVILDSIGTVGSEITANRGCVETMKIGSVAYRTYRYEHPDGAESFYNNKQHWYGCAYCGEVYDEKETHYFDYACSDDCAYCDYQRTADCKYDEWFGDDIEHWRRCTYCGAQKDAGDHIPGAAATLDTPQLCTVCGLVLQEALSHEHDSTGDWIGDSTRHWLECDGCTAKLNIGDHILPQGADPTVENLCEVCGVTVPPNYEHTHVPTGRMEYDEQHHWQICNSCNEIVNKTQHSFGEGILTLAPTTSREGEYTYVCTDCDAIRIEVIKRLPQESQTEDGADDPPEVFDDVETDGGEEPILGNNSDGDSDSSSGDGMTSSDDGQGMWIVLLIGGTLLLLGAGAIVILILKKKKKAR